MNQIPESANISFLEAEDDSEPSNMRQAVSKPNERRIPAKTDLATLGTPVAAWSEALTCEARNSLQVVLSGTEILLEDHSGNLQPHQKTLLSKVMDNAYHLCHLISLLGPEEFKLDQMSANEINQIRQVAGTRIS